MHLNNVVVLDDIDWVHKKRGGRGPNRTTIQSEESCKLDTSGNWDAKPNETTNNNAACRQVRTVVICYYGKEDSWHLVFDHLLSTVVIWYYEKEDSWHFVFGHFTNGPVK